MDTQQTAQDMQSVISTLRSAGTERLILGCLILIIGIILVKIVMRLIERAASGMRKSNPTIYTMFRGILKFVLYLMVVMVSAGTLGISTTSFVALFSVIALAASLSVQNILSSFAGGIILLVSKPLKEGDFVEVSESSGTVCEVGFLQTKLLSPDGRRIYIPNNLLYSSKVINYTVNGKRRVELSVSASYENDPQSVRESIEKAIRQVDGILDNPSACINLESYDDSAIRYSVWVWCEPNHYLDVKYKLNEKLYYTFAENGIEMTYPHINVHMKAS